MGKIVLWLPVILIISLITFVSAQNNDMLYAGLNNSEKSDERATSEQLANGEEIFNASCRVCHVNGGNIINPRFPLRGSQKLEDFETFLSFIRNPKMPDGSTGAMPSFPESSISNDETKKLFQYLVSEYGLNRGN
jgi:mono/diheme cytochrome c family protein